MPYTYFDSDGTIRKWGSNTPDDALTRVWALHPLARKMDWKPRSSDTVNEESRLSSCKAFFQLLRRMVMNSLLPYVQDHKYFDDVMIIDYISLEAIMFKTPGEIVAGTLRDIGYMTERESDICYTIPFESDVLSFGLDSGPWSNLTIKDGDLAMLLTTTDATTACLFSYDSRDGIRTSNLQAMVQIDELL